MLAAVLGLLGWNMTTVQKLTVTTAVQATSLQNIVEKINIATLDRYTGSQARSDLALVEQRLGRIEQWSQNLSERIRAVERDKMP